jgi:hypothetical protein
LEKKDSTAAAGNASAPLFVFGSSSSASGSPFFFAEFSV